MKSITSVFIKATCMLAFVLVSNSFSLTQAQPMRTYSPVADSGDIRFVHAQEGMLVFELNLKNLPAKGSILTIKDESGNLLFEQTIKTENYSRLYKIEKNSISKIIFEISGKKILLNKSFSVNSWTEEKVEVAKL